MRRLALLPVAASLALLATTASAQTVLARAVHAAGLEFDSREAHSAVYDAERTAQLFCIIANAWPQIGATAPSAPPASSAGTISAMDGAD